MSQNEIAAKIAQIKELALLIEEAEQESEALKDEIKAHMTAMNAEEITAGAFKVRYTTVTSNRFDTTAFRKTHSELYEQYTRTTESRRFSIA